MSPALTPDGAPEQPRARERYWLHGLLFLLTVVTTSAVGARLAYNFDHNRPVFLEDDLIQVITGFGHLLAHPSMLLPGLPFSITLLTILLAHEMGHYLTCVHYNIDASLPYFLPMPTLIGTLGAFIRIRSAILSKKELFDVGIAGPLAGFAFAVPALGIGLALSKVIPGIASQGDIVFSTPGILRLVEMMVFPGAGPADIYLHPIARAAWVGVFATALNLLPIGQLDGGHIVYSFAGAYHKILSYAFIATLVVLGFFYSPSWFIWAIFLFFFGLRHPRIYDPNPMDRLRTRLGVLALVIFALSFTVAPIAQTH